MGLNFDKWEIAYLLNQFQTSIIINYTTQQLAEKASIEANYQWTISILYVIWNQQNLVKHFWAQRY